MTGLFTLGLETLLALALLGVAILCWRLDRRLEALRSGRDDAMASTVALLDAVTRAEAAVHGLRATSADVGTNLQARIDEARTLAERLDSKIIVAKRAPLPAEGVQPAPSSLPVRARTTARPAPNWADLR